MPDTGVARVRIIGQNHAGVTVNVLHFATAVELGDATTQRNNLIALAQAILDCVRAALLPALPSDWALSRITAQFIGSQLSDEVEAGGVVATDIGEIATDSDVSFAAQQVSIMTGQGGRRKRGRFFLPPPPESGVSNSRLTPGQIALLAAFLACLAGKFIPPGNTTSWRLGVLSRVNMAAANGNALAAFTEGSLLRLNPVLATMHSRKLGQGS